VLDRFIVLHVAPPSAAMMRAVMTSITADVAAHNGRWFDAALARDVADRLAAYPPRRLSRLLDQACAYAASENRRAIMPRSRGRDRRDRRRTAPRAHGLLESISG